MQEALFSNGIPPSAEYYRTFVRLQGEETELQPVGRASAKRVILHPLPVNAKLEVAVSAGNAGGESARRNSLVVEVRSKAPSETTAGDDSFAKRKSSSKVSRNRELGPREEVEIGGCGRANLPFRPRPL